MNERWNLDPIYKGFSDPAYVQDMKTLEEKLQEIAAYSEKLRDGCDPLVTLKEGIALQEDIYQLISSLLIYANLRQSANTRDPEAASQMGRIMALYSCVAAPKAAFEAWASALPELMELVEKDAFLQPYTFMFANIKENSRYLLPGMGEEIMAKMSISGSSAWSDLQSYITSTVPVMYRGEKTNLPTIRNLAYDPDPQVRKDAFEAEIACYERIEAPAAFAMNSIKLETLTDCQLRGYASPLERTLKQWTMTKQTLDAMFGAMQEYMPKFRQYMKCKAKALGHENGLPWYDLFAPMGGMDTKMTAEDAREYLVNIFSRFDKELADMVADAFDNEWIDFYPRDGKTGGAFCVGVPAIRQSRVLTNFDGAFTDVVTLAHELGHAFHNYCLQDQRPLNQDYSMPLAETASTFNECVVMATAIQDAKNNNEKLALIESQLQDATQIICDIYSRYLFEESVFNNRSDSFMDAPALCNLMTDAQKRSYGDGLDENCLHPYMWVCKSHYYGPTFYNFPYAFGGLFARGLYAQYEKEGESFVPKYKQLLRTTPVAYAEDVAKVADIDLTSKEFWRAGLQTIADQIDLFCSLVAAGE
ncbi:MAG: M3 family oligoendopeptidase [Oscillospiraceae bacterium]|nr:M3 family oligoendopeptidase [Oscillospiraceae bacterium]